jgi:tripartite-type tricarboxylate transporter receptor subunit TctC
MDYGKANPGKLVIGNGGSGTAQHLAGELLTSMAGIHGKVAGPASNSWSRSLLMSLTHHAHASLPGETTGLFAPKFQPTAALTTKIRLPTTR